MISLWRWTLLSRLRILLRYLIFILFSKEITNCRDYTCTDDTKASAMWAQKSQGAVDQLAGHDLTIVTFSGAQTPIIVTLLSVTIFH